MKYIDIRVSALSEEDLVSFIRLCGIIQGAGEKGEGREFKIFVDGDGSGTFKFQSLEDGKPKDFESFDLPKDVLWLGE